MSRNTSERRAPLTLVDPPIRTTGMEPSATDEPTTDEPTTDEPTTGDPESLRRPELSLSALARELAEAVVHLERASLAAKGTGFTGRVRDAFDEVDKLQRSASEEFGRKVGDRLGREALWRRRRGVEVG